MYIYIYRERERERDKDREISIALVAKDDGPERPSDLRSPEATKP